MDLLSFFIMAAIIYGIMGIFGQNSTNRPKRPPQRYPAPPQRFPAPQQRFPAPQPRYPDPQSPTPFEVRPKSTRVETTVKTTSSEYNAQRAELERAQGREGAWGDEGRASRELWSPEGQSDYDYSSLTSNVGDQARSSGSSMESQPYALSEQNLVQAVVWAEILGKPRGARPFNRQFVK